MAYLTPNAADYDEVCRVLVIPAGLAAVVMGALDELTRDWNWEQHGDMLVSDCVAAVQDMIDAAYGSDCMTQTIMYPDWYTAPFAAGHVVAGTLSGFQIQSSQPFGGFWDLGVAIDNEMDFDVMLDEGDYDIYISYSKRTNAGIISVSIDAGSPAAMDAYAASASSDWLSYVTLTGITAGAHTLKLKAHTKNAASAGYRMPVSYIFIHRNGA